MPRPREFDEDEVVAKATEVFHAKGYRRTAPRDLLEATGLSKSSLYGTFGSKEGLFLRSLERYVEGSQASTRAMLAAGSLRDALTRLFDAQIASVTAPEGARSCLVCTASIDAEPDDTDLVARLGQLRRRGEQLFQERIEQAQAAGEVDPDRDPAALARFISSNNMGMVVLARSGATATELHAIAEQVIDAVCGPR